MWQTSIPSNIINPVWRAQRAISGSWSDSEANAAVGGVSARQFGDIVTLTTADGYSGRRKWDGSAWVSIDGKIESVQVINGDISNIRNISGRIVDSTLQLTVS